MSTGISEGLRFLSGSSDPHSPPSVGLGISPPRRSTSPGYESNPEKPLSRKRTNTTSSGGGEKRTANKICRVCGDKAFSYNFNVITCESCKAFFRRNANKEKEIRCPFNEQCEINVVSRRFCQRCRLSKCFDVGMKKEWIMSDEARLEKKQRVEENRERRLQDALARASESQEMEIGTHRERVKSESKPDEQLPVTARDFIVVPEEKCSMIMTAEVSSVISSPLCPSQQLIDSVPTTAAHSLADVSAITTATSSMDVDPTTTMSSSGFIPPTVPDSAASLLPVSVTNAVESSLMAQAQLAAAQVQVQAAINHQQQQIAAAVVAQQVAAHIASAAPVPPTVAPTIAPSLTQSLPATIPAPILAPSLPPSLATPPTASLLHSLNTPIAPIGSDMVTIPREVLVKLIENNTPRIANCTCTCLCGRYPPGSVIVDEVTKDLLAAGGNCSSCEAKDEAKLETTEDFQMNGLLPSDDSSVQWLNASAPTVDPSAVMEDRPAGRRDSFYKSSLLEAQIHPVNVDPDCCLMTSSDHDRLNDVISANKTWKELDFKERHRRDERYQYKRSVVSLANEGIRLLIRMCKRLPSFRSLNNHDQVILIKHACIPYVIIREAMSYDPSENMWCGISIESGLSTRMDSLTDSQEDMKKHSIRFYSTLKEELRTNENIMLLFSVMIVFDADAPGLRDREIVGKEHAAYGGLLKRLLFTMFGQDSTRANIEQRCLIDKLPMLRELANKTINLVPEVDPAELDLLLHEMFD